MSRAQLQANIDAGLLVYHEPTCCYRRVCAASADGSVLQLAAAIKHNGATLYHVDARDCLRAYVASGENSP